jgi:RHS repeat-associated protein
MEQDFAYTTTWKSDYSAWTQKTTTVTTIDLIRPGRPSFKTVYTYLPMQSANQVVGPSTTYPVPVLPVESTVAYYDTTGVPLRTVTKKWNTPDQLAAECTTLDNGQTAGTFYQYAQYSWGSVNSIASQTSQAYATDLVTDRAEYDYGTVGSTCQQPTSIPIRETKMTYASLGQTPFWQLAPALVDRPNALQVYGNGTLLSETDYAYDETTSAPVSPAPYGHDETNYGPSAATQWSRGNPTTITKKCWIGTASCTNSVWKIAYDTTGQPVSVTDADGNTTTISYADNFASGTGTPSQPTNEYPTMITRPVTSGVSHMQTFQWNYNQGELAVLTDENGKSTYSYYNDPWNRPTEADYPDGGVTKHVYHDSAPISITTCQLMSGTASASCSQSSPPVGWITGVTLRDGIGHVTQTQLVSDPDGTTHAPTTYDGLGRSYQVYNPTRCSAPTTNCGESTWGVTTYTYDALGRVMNVLEPDGSATTKTYSGDQTTVTDEAGNQRTSQTDSLGRLAKIWEGPNVGGLNYETDYQYDALGNLLCVVQKGTDTTAFTTCAAASANWRPRSFVYDSLSRLTSAANPESGTVTYAYDLNGNLSNKTAPKPNPNSTGTVTTNYSYDVLNRLTKKSYVNLTTPTAQYAYDGNTLTGCTVAPPSISSPTNLVGRRSAMCAGLSASKWSYDPMGRQIVEKRTNQGSSNKTQTLQYLYNLDGSLKTLVYPSGKVLNYTIGGAGRVTQIDDTLDIYATSIAYTPNGSVAGGVQGPAAITNAYNDRLQPILLSAALSGQSSFFSLCYDFHLHVAINTSPCSFSAYTTGDNGNVFQVLNNVDSTRSAVYAYDALNRVAQANTIATTGSNCWGEVYTIDNWGSLTNRAGVSGMGSCSTEGLSATATTKNQLSGNGVLYDAAGNVTNDGIGNMPTYDAENRIVTDVGFTYSYDADGTRMEKSTGSSGTMYWLGPSGTLAETDLTGTINEEYIYFNGERIARVDRPSGTVHYYFSNHLGSHTMVTSAAGSCEQDIDYYPYGGVVRDHCPTVAQHYKFTGKERDTESGLDNFGARYFGSSLGRFMTPDWAARPTTVPYAEFSDPQSLNLYNYVRNDPISRIDRDGHYEVNASNCGDDTKCQKRWEKATDKFEKRREKDLNSKKADVRAAAAAYGAKGEANGVHVGFADLASQNINGSVDVSGSTLGTENIQVTLDFGRAGSAETQTHEGTHVMDDKKFLDSINPLMGGYDQTLNPTHGQTEFNAFKAGAEINQEHGFGPNDTQNILNFLHNSPVYGPIFNVPVFDPAKFPAQSWPSGWPYGPYD